MGWVVALIALGVLAGVQTATTNCKNCITMGKEQKAIFRAHSDACLSRSRVEPRLVEQLLQGELTDDPSLKSHVYCVLLKCKIVSKDGKLQKSTLLGKIANRADSKNALKVIESCAEQTGDTPEELAWNLLRCGFDKKAVFFNYMPTIADDQTEVENNFN